MNFDAKTTEDLMNSGLKIGEFKFQARINQELINIANGKSDLCPMSFVLLQNLVNDYYKESRMSAISQFVSYNFNFYLKECKNNPVFKSMFQILNPALIKSAVIISTCHNTIKISYEKIEDVKNSYKSTLGTGPSASFFSGSTKPTNQVSSVYPLLLGGEFLNEGPNTQVNYYQQAYNQLTKNVDKDLYSLRENVGTIIYCYRLMEQHVVNMAFIHGCLVGMEQNEFNKFVDNSLKRFHMSRTTEENKRDDIVEPLTISLSGYFQDRGGAGRKIQDSLSSLKELEKRMEGCLDEISEIKANKANKNNIQNSIIANQSANSTNLNSFRQPGQLTEDNLTQVGALLTQGQQKVQHFRTLLSETCDTAASASELNNHAGWDELNQVINGAKTTYGLLIEPIKIFRSSIFGTIKQQSLATLNQAYVDYQKSDWCVILHKNSSPINEGLLLKKPVAKEQLNAIVEKVFKTPFKPISNQAITNFGAGEVQGFGPELAVSEPQNQTQKQTRLLQAGELLLQAGELLVQEATRSKRTGSAPAVSKNYESGPSFNLPPNAAAKFERIRERNVSGTPQFNSKNPPFVDKPAFPLQGTPYKNAVTRGVAKPAVSSTTSSVPVTENPSAPVLAIKHQPKHQPGPADPNPRKVSNTENKPSKNKPSKNKP